MTRLSEYILFESVAHGKRKRLNLNRLSNMDHDSFFKELEDLGAEMLFYENNLPMEQIPAAAVSEHKPISKPDLYMSDSVFYFAFPDGSLYSIKFKDSQITRIKKIKEKNTKDLPTTPKIEINYDSDPDGFYELFSEILDKFGIL